MCFAKGMYNIYVAWCVEITGGGILYFDRDYGGDFFSPIFRGGAFIATVSSVISRNRLGGHTFFDHRQCVKLHNQGERVQGQVKILS